MGLSGLQVGEWWPLLVAVLVILVLVAVWLRHKGDLFPDIKLLSGTASLGGVLDFLPMIIGVTVVALIILSLMDISISHSITLTKRARDFLVIVDTSRSMRENTSLLRKDNPPTYERRAGLYSGETNDPSKIPKLGRYEVARESLLHFLASRRDVDRIALIYFNSQVYLMSGFTSNFDFLRQQLKGMDPYVTQGTNIRWAMEKGLDMLQRYPSKNRQAVILLTDAETRATNGLQQQLARLSKLNIPFYLLWITTDAAGGVSDDAREFLRRVRDIGTVFTISDLEKGHLDEALSEIGKLEDYAYKEVRHEQINLSPYFLGGARWLMLFWILLIATIYHPVRRHALAKRS